MKMPDLTSLTLSQQKVLAGGVSTNGVPSAPNMASLQRKVGPIANFQLSLDESRHAKEALKEINKAQTIAEKGIALTAIKLAETQIRASLVGTATPAIGALAVRVNAAITAVDQSLTNGCQAETYTHLKNRANNAALANELCASGAISPEESEILSSLAAEDANNDIQRSRERMLRAKQAVAELGDYALNHIAEAKQRLS